MKRDNLLPSEGSTVDFYTKNAYTWQTNTDDLFKCALKTLFTKAKDALNSQDSDRVLEIGCGMGEFLEYKPKGEYVGIDISIDNISEARKRYPNNEFHAMDALNLDFKPEYFDKIICIETIEHLTIRELVMLYYTLPALIKPGGTIVITTPNLFYLWGLIPWSFWPIKRRLSLTKFFKGFWKGYVDENYNLPVHHYRFHPGFLKKFFGYFFIVDEISSTYWYNNRVIHKLFPKLQMKLMEFSAKHKFLGLNLGSQLIIKLRKAERHSKTFIGINPDWRDKGIY